MIIERAKPQHLEGINRLLHQVLNIHQKGRPDLFREGSKKYSDDELLALMKDDDRPIYVAVAEGQVLGYAFCIYECSQSRVLKEEKALYIDDLCVDASCRGQHIGRSLYEYVLQTAKENNCYRVTLNVWSCNPEAMGFYEKMGMQPYKVAMEQIL